MERECLEQLESNRYSGIALRKEITDRFYQTINNIEGLTFGTACSAQEALIHCGFNYLEALYLICGKRIRNCSLLSKQALDFLQRFIEEESDDLKEPWENKLENMIQELNEKIFLFYLERDSERLKKVIMLSIEPKSKVV